MSKPSRRANRENRPKKKRDRQLRQRIQAVPIVVGFFDLDGNSVEFSLDCDRCWSRITADDEIAQALPGCDFCADRSSPPVY